MENADYNVLLQNCVQAVDTALEEAGFRTWTALVPRAWFDNLLFLNRVNPLAVPIEQ